MGICPRCKEDNEFPGGGLCTWCYRVVYKAQDECLVLAEKRRMGKGRRKHSTAQNKGVMA